MRLRLRMPVSGLTILLALLVHGGGEAASLEAQQLTQEEALRVAFPEATRIERRTAFLEPPELRRAAEASGDEAAAATPVITHYVGLKGETPLGVAYFDAHRVRTKREVIMIVVDPSARVRHIEVLAFAEPPEYRAPEPWLAQFESQRLGAQLERGRAIRNMTGATLTSRAIVDATRRILALHAEIDPFQRQRVAGK